MDASKPLPCPFRIAIDTREQLKYAFATIRADANQHNRPLVIETVTKCLESGDYSIEGMEHRISIERKSLSDCFSTFSAGRKRFERELHRLSLLEFAAVVIEAEWSEIMRSPPVRSNLNPKCVIRSVMAWQVRFPTIAWWTVPGREVAEAVTFRILERFWIDKNKVA